ncbi:hypothetical protein IV203_018109 [Nitzschia inconspicua]|uniref:Uncharacterized protein n=1 Tax=Nitzschia inconspicua TaxID=303405 RepID=A0A9K3Q5A3_9STRA|nr:hypothetical protein IV203_018109 [Nitzschia inconspicua]
MQQLSLQSDRAWTRAAVTASETDPTISAIATNANLLPLDQLPTLERDLQTWLADQISHHQSWHPRGIDHSSTTDIMAAFTTMGDKYGDKLAAALQTQHQPPQAGLMPDQIVQLVAHINQMTQRNQVPTQDQTIPAGRLSAEQRIALHGWSNLGPSESLAEFWTHYDNTKTTGTLETTIKHQLFKQLQTAEPTFDSTILNKTLIATVSTQAFIPTHPASHSPLPTNGLLLRTITMLKERQQLPPPPPARSRDGFSIVSALTTPTTFSNQGKRPALTTRLNPNHHPSLAAAVQSWKTSHPTSPLPCLRDILTCNKMDTNEALTTCKLAPMDCLRYVLLGSCVVHVATRCPETPCPKTPLPTSLPTEDDVTVITGKSTSRPSTAKVWQETVVKLRFQSKDDLLTKDVSYLAFGVLNAIKQSFPTRIKIKLNNANMESHNVQAPTNDDDFQKLFGVSHRRGNKAKKIQSQSWIIFRIFTDMTLATIRKEQTVHDALQRSHGNLVYYPWTEDVHDVVSLGFFVGPLPKYMTSSQFEEELIPLISAKANIDAKRIPKHHCVMETITTYQPGTDLRFKCQAFVIQVEQQHSLKLREILNKAFSSKNENLLFVLFEQRRSHPAIFAKAVHRQAEYEAKHRIVAIHGIRPDTMFEFDVVLRQSFPQILQVYRTPTTAYLNCGGEPLGRYNLLCKTTAFTDLARALHIKLAETYHTFVQQIATPQLDTTHEEEVRVVSRFPTPSTPGSQATLTTRHSYITCSHSVLTEQEFTTDTIPRESWSVRTKPHPPVPTTIHDPSQLEAPQATQIHTPATPRHTSWSTVAAGTITALPPT